MDACIHTCIHEYNEHDCCNRPYFSGCGRSVYETLEDIKEGKTNISELPPIQVLVGDESMDDDQGQWYFSLNNRRLWVLKRLREEGHLEKYGNKIAVRVRRPKSQQERERYTLANCSLEARIIPEKKKTQKQQQLLQPQKQNQNQQNENQNQSSKPTHVENNVNVDVDDDGGGDNGDDDGNGDEEGSDDNVENDDEDSDSDDDSRAAVTMRNRFAITMLDDSSSSDDDDD